MRILAISHNYPHEDDPTCGIFAARQFQQINRIGHNVHVIVPLAYLPNFINRLERYKLFRPRNLAHYSGVHAEVVCYLRPPGRLGLLVDGPSAFLAVRKKILRFHLHNSFDLILARGFWLEAEIGIHLSRLMHIPVAAIGIGSDVNEMPELGKFFWRKFCWITQNVDLAMATGKGVANKISAIRNKETPVIGGLVDLALFKPVSDKRSLRKLLNIPLDKKVLLFVGHLIKAKGLYELIEAFREIQAKRQDLYLIICGDGLERGHIEVLIHSNHLENDIYMAGNILPQDICQWYQISDIFVFPSYMEGMPNAVMEAMACGLPTVATNVGGMAAALEGCRGAILVESRNSHAISEAILNILSDDQLRKQMSVAARQKAKENFEIEQNVSRMMCYMEQVKNEYDCKK